MPAMANRSMCPTVAICLVILSAMVSYSTAAMELRVGGRMKVKDVKRNEQVQALGRYCVEQYNYNRRQQQLLRDENNLGGSGGGDLIRFKEVVEAEKQVVSGIKYYLKIKGSNTGGGGGGGGGVGSTSSFDAVVLVKPWARSKELLNFGPASSSSSDATN